jgi:hypothetical protein
MRDPPFPFELGPVSNGEYLPPPKTPFAREVERRTLDAAERHARRIGMDRRRFLLTLGGAATMLLALDACSSDDAASRGQRPGGRYRVPTTAPTEPEEASDALAGEEVIFDVQTHFLDPDGTAGNFALGFPQARCGEDPRQCFRLDIWLDEVYGKSDTSMAILSALPLLSEPNPLSIDVMERARAAVDDVCGTGRVLLHGQVNPNVGNLAARLDGMAALVEEHPIAAWKVYTHIGDPPYTLDDHDRRGAPVGRAFLEHVERVGPRIVCVHKGFGDAYWASPADLGPAARAHPDLAFVCYHSGFESGVREGPYVAGRAHRGVDRLIETVVDHGPGAGRNVYAEIGSTWFMVMRDPTQAAHVLGKLLKHVGEDNLLWGTDSIWYGSPQEQIEAFRAFEIAEEFQDRFGYPALTDAVKRKILGGNAARLYGVDLPAAVCRPSAEEIDALRVAAGPRRTYGPRTDAEARSFM